MRWEANVRNQADREERQTYPSRSRAEKFSRNPTGSQDDLTGNEWKWAGIYTGRADGESRNRCAGRRGEVRWWGMAGKRSYCRARGEFWPQPYAPCGGDSSDKIAWECETRSVAALQRKEITWVNQWDSAVRIGLYSHFSLLPVQLNKCWGGAESDTIQPIKRRWTIRIIFFFYSCYFKAEIWNNADISDNVGYHQRLETCSHSATILKEHSGVSWWPLHHNPLTSLQHHAAAAVRASGVAIRCLTGVVVSLFISYRETERKGRVSLCDYVQYGTVQYVPSFSFDLNSILSPPLEPSSTTHRGASLPVLKAFPFPVCLRRSSSQTPLKPEDFQAMKTDLVL